MRSMALQLQGPYGGAPSYYPDELTPPVNPEPASAQPNPTLIAGCSRSTPPGAKTGDAGARPPVASSQPIDAEKKLRQTLERLEEPSLKIRTELKGDPNRGTLLFIRQIHGWHYLQTGQEKDFVQVNRLAGDYQAKILRALRLIKPQHVFVEGYDQDSPPEARASYLAENEQLRRNIKSHPLLKNSDWSGDAGRTWFLAFLGAPALYAEENSDFFLHKTATAEEKKQVEGFVEKGVKDGRLDLKSSKTQAFLMTQREDWAVRELSDFFREAAGREAVLVYGSDHQFCDDFQRRQLGVTIVSLWFAVADIEESLPPGCL